MQLTNSNGKPYTTSEYLDRIESLLEIPDMDGEVQHDYTMFRDVLRSMLAESTLTDYGVIVPHHGWRTVPPPGYMLCSDGVARTHSDYIVWRAAGEKGGANGTH